MTRANRRSCASLLLLRRERILQHADVALQRHNLALRLAQPARQAGDIGGGRRCPRVGCVRPALRLLLRAVCVCEQQQQ